MRMPRTRAASSVMPVGKVAHVVLSLEPGGLEMLVCNLVRAQAMRDIEAIICCLDERGRLADKLEAEAVANVVVIKRKPGLDVGIIWRLARFFRRERVTVVHTHTLAAMFYGGLAAWLARVPVRIHTQHETRLRTYGWKDRFRFRLAAKCFGKIVVLAEEIHSALSQYGVPYRRRATILNGIDTTCFSTDPVIRNPLVRKPIHHLGFRRHPEEWVIGTVARLYREKGVDRLLEAFSDVHAVQGMSRLVVIGDGPQRSELEAQAERLGIRSAVAFLGYQSEVGAFLPSFDLFVLPSRREGLPLALLEAMASGVPVVATAVGGVPEVIVHGDSGLLVPPDDADALRHAICKLMMNPRQRSRIGVNGASRVRARFRLSIMAQAYRRLYLEVPSGPLAKRFVKEHVVRVLPRRWMLWDGGPHGSDVALTFDDGPDRLYTPQILDILKQYGIKATFFLIGEKVAQEPGVVRRLVQEGHEIGNHSYTHPRFDQLSLRQATEEINRTQLIIRETVGEPCRLFRPPWGKLSPTEVIAAWLHRLTVVMWSVDLKDFRSESPDDIVAGLAARPIWPGDVVLYHAKTQAALRALPYLVECAGRNGQRIVPVSQLR